MKNKYYLYDWENSTKDEILDEFEFNGDRSKIEILFASYTYENYSGDAFVIAEKDGKLYEVNAGHCSCYGLEGQFELEETSIEAIEHYIKKGNFFHWYKDELIEFIKEYKELKKKDWYIENISIDEETFDPDEIVECPQCGEYELKDEMVTIKGVDICRSCKVDV